MSNFESELIESDMNRIDPSPLADPYDNYSIIHKIINNVKQKHIPANGNFVLKIKHISGHMQQFIL